jgi:Lecithin:cholesterol acyltransferase
MTATDVVVVLPGITGSTLNKNGQPVWAPSPTALLNGIFTLGRSLKELKLPKGIGDQHPGDGVEPVGLMPDVHLIPGVWSPIRGYSTLIRRLNNLCSEGKLGKVVPVAYDWRLSNRYNATVRVKKIVEDELGAWRKSDPSHADARVIFVCHSMVGLIARWYIEKCGGIDHTRKLITLGTPFRGAARAIDQLVNGVRKGLGPLALDLSVFARSMPSSYQLLPDYACVDRSGGLLRLDEITVPGLDTGMLTDGLAFHRDLTAAAAQRSAAMETSHAIVGVKQPTATTVRLTESGVEVLQTIGGDNDYGDATVPLAGAIRDKLPMDTNQVRRVVDQHGNLQLNGAAWDEIESVITSQSIRRRDVGAVAVRLDAPELVLLGEEISIVAGIEPDSRGNVPAVRITFTPEQSYASRPSAAVVRTPRIRDLHLATSFTPEHPGVYKVEVDGVRPGSVDPVTASVVVWPPEQATGRRGGDWRG